MQVMWCTAMIYNGDSLVILKEMETNSIESVVTDPPYGLSFMGKDWDKALPPIEVWKECFRVLKPGGYIIAMSASRTWHRLAVQLEDLGFIVHPMIGWIYGSGFPKATDLSKQFDKQAGVVGEVIGKNPAYRKNQLEHDARWNTAMRPEFKNAPSTDLAKQWDGWKYGLQSLKPALEPIFVGQKPHLKPMVKNVEAYGVGAMNIDACRVSVNSSDPNLRPNKANHQLSRASDPYSSDKTWSVSKTKKDNSNGETMVTKGRHPANLLHDGSMDGEHSRFFNNLPITDMDAPFLYQAKASKAERNKGLEGMEAKAGLQDCLKPLSDPRMSREQKRIPNQNHHPTVKPVKLMEWLVKLVTPPKGTCLDPFGGSGTTGVACKLNGFNFIVIEREKDFYEIAKRRIDG